MIIPNYELCPADVKESIDAYVDMGRPTGGFLRAVLANDLMEAIGRADSDNMEALPHICCYVYQMIPATCHGSYDIVDRWIDRKEKQLMERLK